MFFRWTIKTVVLEFWARHYGGEPVEISNFYLRDGNGTNYALKEYIMGNVRKVQEDRALLYEEMKKMKGIKPYPSQGNFVLADCPKSGKKASEVLKFMYEHGYMIRTFIDYRGLPGDNHFRITIGTHEDTLGVIAALKELFPEE